MKIVDQSHDRADFRDARRGTFSWQERRVGVDRYVAGNRCKRCGFSNRKGKGRALLKRDFSPTFTVEQMRKDIGLILDAGNTLNVPIGLTALTAQMLSSAGQRGMPMKITRRL